MTDNAADPKQARESKRKAKERQEQEAADFRSVLASESGRRFLWAELDRRNVFRTAFHIDALVFAHNEGLRSAGVALMNLIIQTDPQAWILMQQEAAKLDQ